MDLLQREGKYPVPPQAPSTLGVEFSGVIKSFGDQTESDFGVGDEVFGLAYGGKTLLQNLIYPGWTIFNFFCFPGAYAEYISVSIGMLVHKPTELSWVEAAGIPEARKKMSLVVVGSSINETFGKQTWITATQAMYLVGEFTPGKSILWHAGSSSVSIAGIQLSKADNASSIYVTVGSQEKIDFCVKELGATAGFNYRTQDWATDIRNVTNNQGVDLIIDVVGATHFQGNLDVAARDGRIVELGQMSGSNLPAGVNISPILMKRLRIEGSTLRSRDEQYQKKLRDLLVEHALPKFKDGSFKVLVERVFPFERIADAHRLLESNQTKGKVICTVS
jgi:NADPH2:quinone reductase